MLPHIIFCEPYSLIVAHIVEFVNSNRGQTGIAILKPIFLADR